jgi:hypothetical protein
MDRRTFLKTLIYGTLFVATGMFVERYKLFEKVGNFLEEERKRNAPIDVTIKELNESPEKYVERTIRVKGYPEYVGYNSYCAFFSLL